MNIDEKIQTARAIIAEAETRDGQAWALMRGLLGEIDEDLISLRRQVAQKQIEFLTEREFAARLKVSASTIARIRQAGEIEPLLVGPNGIRYSSLQLERIHEILGAKAKPKKRKLEIAA